MTKIIEQSAKMVYTNIKRGRISTRQVLEGAERFLKKPLTPWQRDFLLTRYAEIQEGVLSYEEFYIICIEAFKRYAPNP